MRYPPNHRTAVIQGLRELADELSVKRDLPVPLIVAIEYHPRGNNDAEKRHEIRRVAEILGVEPEFTAGGDHYEAVRMYGAVEYRALTVSAEAMARWDALMSYSDQVTPDNNPPENATK